MSVEIVVAVQVAVMLYAVRSVCARSSPAVTGATQGTATCDVVGAGPC